MSTHVVWISDAFTLDTQDGANLIQRIFEEECEKTQPSNPFFSPDNNWECETALELALIMILFEIFGCL